ncbi:MAG: long-chain-fatty-acyl-CoA reductase [Lachnospiraceae bacterium]|nr:long-chain-fatty-acyl-CoA reductase [Lachnospiraceae bacterium]
MLKLGGVVIPMRPENKDLCFLVGNQELFCKIQEVKALEVFHPNILMFLETLSSKLLKDATIRQYSDVVAFAFWIRKKNLEHLSETYKNGFLRMGRGIVFHITPANIPIQFAISLIYGLLSGNGNIVRVSERSFEEVDVICRAIRELLEEERFAYLRDYIYIIRYGHEKEITRQLSEICDVRVVWGGNATIQYIRQFPISPRAVEICFADRDSFCIIDSDRYLQGNYQVLAKDFYHDTYYVDQNACSSPHLIIWTGKEVEKAKQIFWTMLKEELADYQLPPLAGSEKLLRFCMLAAREKDLSYVTDGMELVRVEIEYIWGDLLDYKVGMGYFFEYTANELEEIVPLLRKPCQTVSYYGVNPEHIKNIIQKYGVRGVDRIVPMGHTQELSLEWDGIDVIESLSRKVNISFPL